MQWRRPRRQQKQCPLAQQVTFSTADQPHVGAKFQGSYHYVDPDGDGEGGTIKVWLRDGVPIAGADQDTYEATAEDSGKKLQYSVTPAAASGKSPGDTVVSSSLTIENSAPTATLSPPRVGTASILTTGVGSELNVDISYNDVDGDAAAPAEIRWLRRAASATDEIAIPNATNRTYMVKLADLDQSIVAEVTPVALKGVLRGAAVRSKSVLIVNSVPVAIAQSVVITANTSPVIVNSILTANYTYFDADNDPQGASIYEWSDGATVIGTGATYTVVAANVKKTLSVKVTPIASSGSSPGVASTSAGLVIDNGPPSITGKLNDTGITAGQCYQVGSDLLVSCGSVGATTLNPAQDGMVGRDANVGTNDNTDGKLGFNFANVAGGCVQDNVTGLMWEVKTADGGLRDWSKTYTHYDSTITAQKSDGTAPTQAEIDAATNSIGFKNSANSQALCGFSDWRLPSADELHSIVDYSLAGPATVDAIWFPNTQANAFWSASSYVGDSISAWYVIFNDGRDNIAGRSFPYYVRLVRAGQPPTPPRYTVSADGQEIIDSQTRLIWRRCSEGMVFSGGTCTGTAGIFTHEAALMRARDQASSTNVAWRLPNVKELASIADKSLSSPAIDVTDFPATPAGYFWSASPYVGNSSVAWLVDFNNGYVHYNFRNFSYYVRLVRAGQ